MGTTSEVAGPLGFEPRVSGLEGRRAFWQEIVSRLRHGPMNVYSGIDGDIIL